MRRRAFLVSGAIPVIALAGCTGSNDDSPDESNGDSSEPGPKEEEEMTDPGQVKVALNTESNSYGTVADIEVVNKSEDTFEKVPISVDLGSTGQGSFNLYNLEPSEKRTLGITVDQLDEKWVELIQLSNESSDPSTGIPFQQSDLSGKGDTLIKHVSENQFLLKAADHGVSDPMEVEPDTEYLSNNHDAISILDNNDIQFELDGPYWMEEQHLNVISTSEEHEVSFFMEAPDFSMTATDVVINGDNQLVSVDIEITAENEYPVFEARVEGVMDSKMDAIGRRQGDINCWYDYPGYAYESDAEGFDRLGFSESDADQLYFVFNDELVRGEQLLQQSHEERIGKTESYTVDALFTPEFPLDDDVLTLHLISGYSVLAKDSINLTDYY